MKIIEQKLKVYFYLRINKQREIQALLVGHKRWTFNNSNKTKMNSSFYAVVKI